MTLTEARELVNELGVVTTGQLHRAAPRLYKAITRRGWRTRIGLALTRRYYRHDFEQAMASGGGLTRGELKRKNRALYNAALRNGWFAGEAV